MPNRIRCPEMKFALIFIQKAIQPLHQKPAEQEH